MDPVPANAGFLRIARRLILWWAMCCCAGCYPIDGPSYSPDGSTILLVNEPPTSSAPTTRADQPDRVSLASHAIVWLYDLERKSTVPVPMPGRWGVRSATWWGTGHDRIWVACERDGPGLKDPQTGKAVLDKDGKPVPDMEALFTVFDLRTRQFDVLAPRLEMDPGWAALNSGSRDFDPFVAGYEGDMVLYADSGLFGLPWKEPAPGAAETPDGSTKYDLYSLKDGHKLKTVELPPVLPVGDGWSIRMPQDRQQPCAIAAFEVYDPQGHRVARLPVMEIEWACRPDYARISADHSAILLAESAKQKGFHKSQVEYDYEVVDLKTLKLTSGPSDSMPGTPLIRQNDGWTIEFARSATEFENTVSSFDPPAHKQLPSSHFILCHYTFDPSKGKFSRHREEVLHCDLGDSFVGHFAPSPDGSQFLVSVKGKRPRLMFIPLKAGVKETDILSVPLEDNPSHRSRAPNGEAKP